MINNQFLINILILFVQQELIVRLGSEFLQFLVLVFCIYPPTHRIECNQSIVKHLKNWKGLYTL